MKCCQSDCCRGYENLFDASYAQKDLDDYRKHGPAKPTRILIEAIISQADVHGVTLLDIGGGVGAIQHELLKKGAQSAVDVDASSSLIAAAKSEAERHGHADRVTYQHGDFVELAGGVEPADIVTLDRVICCYPDMPKLVGLSADRARKWYGLVFPRDTWWMKLGAWVMELFDKLQRDPVPFRIHSSDAVDEQLRRRGFERRFYRRTFLWQIVLYQISGPVNNDCL